MKKRTVIFCLIFVYMLIFSVSAYGGNKGYVCYVNRVGCYGSDTLRVWLDDEKGQFFNKLFVNSGDRRKEMLAILLTAITGNLMVKIRTDLDAGGQPEIKDLYIYAP